MRPRSSWLRLGSRQFAGWQQQRRASLSTTHTEASEGLPCACTAMVAALCVCQPSMLTSPLPYYCVCAGRCRQLSRCFEVLDRMTAAGVPSDSITYTCLIEAAVLSGDVGMAQRVFARAMATGVTNSVQVCVRGHGCREGRGWGGQTWAVLVWCLHTAGMVVTAVQSVGR